jgi:hypothetical protein
MMFVARNISVYCDVVMDWNWYFSKGMRHTYRSGKENSLSPWYYKYPSETLRGSVEKIYKPRLHPVGLHYKPITTNWVESCCNLQLPQVGIGPNQPQIPQAGVLSLFLGCKQGDFFWGATRIWILVGVLQLGSLPVHSKSDQNGIKVAVTLRCLKDSNIVQMVM